MTTHLEQYVKLAEPFGRVVADTRHWDAPSPCDGWCAADVVEHVIDTERSFLGAHADVGTAPDVAADPAAAWREHDARVRGLLADESVATAEFDGHFGPTTVGDTLVRFYGFDLLAHRWDIARSQGCDERFTGHELAILENAVEGFGDALYSDGICRRPIDVGDDADRQTRLLALLGRDAR